MKPSTLVAILVALGLCWGAAGPACKSSDEPSAPSAPPSARERASTMTAPAEEPSAATATPQERKPMVRQPILAGSWYPGAAHDLRAAVDDYLSAATPEGQAPIGLIVPHAGYRYSGSTAGKAIATLRGKTVKRVILMGPSHRVRLRGVALPAATHFKTPLGAIPVDEEAVARLAQDAHFERREDAHAHEHSLEIQLPLLSRALEGQEWKLVPLVVGQIGEADVAPIATALRPLLDEGTVVVASSDFTHYGPNYGYTPFADDVPAKLRQLDMGVYERIEKHDIPGLFAYKQRTGATVCGFLPIAILVALLPDESTTQLIEYTTSGAIVGDWTNSVSYLAVAFRGASWGGAGDRASKSEEQRDGAGEHPLSAAEKATLLELARDTLDTWVREGRKIDPIEGGYAITDRLREDSGAFVTLKRHGQLRGCIGEILPRRPLYLVVRDRAIDAAVNDRRFRPVEPSELDDIHVEVSVLTPPQSVARWQDIVIGRDGILLSRGPYRAVYLPQVAPEQGWNLEETLDHLSRKAGMPASGWREGAEFEVFQAIVFEEEKESS